MKKLVLATYPRTATQKILKFLTNRRQREVIERRYGLVAGKKETLEAIGKSHGITRERVRQIEEDGLRRLGEAHVAASIAPMFTMIEKHLGDHGGAAEEKKLFNSIADQKSHPHVSFLLTIAKAFHRKPDDDRFHARWYTEAEALRAAETTLEHTASELERIKKPVSAETLFTMLRNNARAELGAAPSLDTVDAYLGIAKRIAKNPYGEFGLASWPTINPSGVRDKAYAVLHRAGAPMHFREVASVIDKTGWDKRRAHPQTVHNELIKDGRFVLVGRGIYALKEWGYEPGTVADVIAVVMKKAGRPLTKAEVIARVLEHRKVKENTILLNLQNKKRFHRSGEGYSVA